MRLTTIITLLVLGWAIRAHAQERSEESLTEYPVIYEFGWASEWSRQEGFRSAGGAFAVEVTPIEHWLELEAGVGVIHSQADTETSVDVLFKKPWTLSRRVEFMAGVGPELVHDASGFHGGLAVAADLMVWAKHHVGWYAEPEYEVIWQSGGTRRGAALETGLLIGW